MRFESRLLTVARRSGNGLLDCSASLVEAALHYFTRHETTFQLLGMVAAHLGLAVTIVGIAFVEL